MALSARQRRRVAWLKDGHLAGDVDPDDPQFRARWEAQFASITSPEELFLYASESHPAQQPHEWRRVLDHPLCDRGTALLIFWRNSPVYHYGDAPAGGWASGWRHELVREIARKSAAGAYPSAVVQFDPTAFKGVSFLRGHTPDELARVPAVMLCPSPGEPVPPLVAEDFDWSEDDF